MTADRECILQDYNEPPQRECVTALTADVLATSTPVGFLTHPSSGTNVKAFGAVFRSTESIDGHLRSAAIVYVFGVEFVYIGYTVRSPHLSRVLDACFHLTTAYAQRRKFVLDTWSNGHIPWCIAQSLIPPHEVVAGSDGANIGQSSYSELMDASLADPPSHTHFSFSDNTN